MKAFVFALCVGAYLSVNGCAVVHPPSKNTHNHAVQRVPFGEHVIRVSVWGMSKARVRKVCGNSRMRVCTYNGRFVIVPSAHTQNTQKIVRIRVHALQDLPCSGSVLACFKDGIVHSAFRWNLDSPNLYMLGRAVTQALHWGLTSHEEAWLWGHEILHVQKRQAAHLAQR